MALDLYEHNLKAYEAVEKMLAEQNRACVIQPTGTGKTYIIFKLLEKHRNKRFLWLGPSEYIYRMQMKNLQRTQKIRYNNSWFTTYAWLMNNTDRLQFLKPDYIILDEFHRAGALKWGEGVKELLREYPQAKVVGFSATNIRYLDGGRDMAEEIFGGSVASEISFVEAIAKDILPTPVYVMAYYEMEQKLRIYQNRIDKIRDRSERERNQKLLDKLRGNLDLSEGMEKIFAKYIHKRDGRFLIFCSNSDKLFEMMARVPEWFHDIDRLPHVYAVHSYNPESEKDFFDFTEDNSNHTKLLFSIDMLNEGIHVPNIDGVILLRPTTSPIVFKQQIGRALSADKKEGPIIFDLVNNIDNLINIQTFEKELHYEQQRMVDCGEKTYISEFRIYDEMKGSRELLDLLQDSLNSPWDAKYDELVKYVNEKNTWQVPRRYVTESGVQLGRWLIRQKIKERNGKLEAEHRDKLAELGVDFRRKNDARFERWMELLQEYVDEHGNCDIPNNYRTAGGEYLGMWVANCRVLYKQGKMSEERIKRLEALGIKWSVLDEQWEEKYRAVCQYYEEHGDIKIPKDYKDGDGNRLRIWLNQQRKVYHGTLNGLLDDEKIKRLNEIGYVWDTQSVKERKFNNNVEEFKKYVAANGNPYVPALYVTADGIQLGRWLCQCRLAYKKHVEKQKQEHPDEEYVLTEKERRLEEAGVIWGSYDMDNWNRMYEFAKAYFEEHGTMVGISPNIVTADGVSIRTWYHQQLMFFRGKGAHPLTAEQMEKLRKLEFQKKTKKEIYQDRIKGEVGKYIRENNSGYVPLEYVTTEGFPLGKNCSRVRNLYRKGKLEKNMVDYLDSIGFIWDRYEHFWQTMYEKAADYYSKNGNLDCSCSYICEDGSKLGQWVADMRSRVKEGTLSAERLILLLSIGFVVSKKI